MWFFNKFPPHRCLNEAGTMDLDDSTEAGVTLVEELLTDFLQVIISFL